MKIVTAIVPHNQGEIVADAAKKAGATGATIQQGRGTAQNQILQILGLGDTEKDIVSILVPLEHCESIKTAIKEKAARGKSHYGILFTRYVHYVVKNQKLAFEANSEEEQTIMNNQSTHELITIIVNAGYAEDAMASARKAGASGGTILNGRGTGKTEDVSFFGITIVPEKEILLILVEKGQASAILEAIKDLDCLSAPGSGIAYCSQVSDFIQLGKDAE